MPQHSDPDDLERVHAVVLAALGEHVAPDLAQHQAGCAQCSRERREFEHVIGLAREPVDRLPAPDVQVPARVWAGIAAELGIAVEPLAVVKPAPAPGPALAPEHRPGRRPNRHRRSRFVPSSAGRRWLVAATAAGVLAAGLVAGYGLGRSTDRNQVAASQCSGTRATLAQMPGGPSGVDGQAAVVCSADGPALRVSTSSLPLRQGFYEVWLYAPSSNTMVAVGTLGANGTGSFTLPDGIDLAAFDVVDVSAQQYDGNPAHDTSVLRGPLTR